MVATFIRPTVGGLIFSATSSAGNLDNSEWMQHNPWVGAIFGVILAGLTHTTKAAIRPAVNVSTVGVGAPVISTVEDIASVGLSLAAIFAPLLVIVFLVILAWAMYRLIRWLLRRRRRKLAAAGATPA
jgi:peptidoglycan/LPS O-acetylase OafA/YrhL